MPDLKSDSAKPWFATWFDSPYYHLLYQKRDDEEARLFIEKLLHYLQLAPGAQVLDLACGKGRHGRVMAACGLQVLGVDLSENSIAEARKWETEKLHFKVGDMRRPQGKEEFEAVFNLFTSFGYFESPEDNLNTLKAIHASLKKGGRLVVDFFNTTKVLNQLEPKAEVIREGIVFQIEKKAESGRIRKTIRFEADGHAYQFEERVQTISFTEFEELFRISGFEIEAVFGNYELQPWSEADSDRMIFIVSKQG